MNPEIIKQKAAQRATEAATIVAYSQSHSDEFAKWPLPDDAKINLFDNAIQIMELPADLAKVFFASTPDYQWRRSTYCEDGYSGKMPSGISLFVYVTASIPNLLN